MNKLVYLFELDSVCKLENQVEFAQKRLFEEALFHGNYVVLSYNQLTDSMAFLSAIYNPYTYEKIIELFKIGVLKVSPYGSVRTPSQYVQSCIERCLADDFETFLFSGVPFYSDNEDESLLEKAYNALKYSDIGILEEELENNKNSQNIEILIRYIKMILVLSIENLAKTKSNKNSFLSFSQIISIVIDKYNNKEQNKIADNFPKDMFNLAISELNNIKNSLKEGINNRSNWIIATDEKPEYWGMCELVINLCYNYTVEQSIDNIYTIYDKIGDEKFFKDFEKRLLKAWVDFNEGLYLCYQPLDFKDWSYQSVILPRWSTAYRILSKIHYFRGFNPKELDNKSEQQLWNAKLIRYFLTAIVTTVAYIGVFILAEHLVDFTKELLSKYFEAIFDKVSDMKALSTILNAIFTTVLFGVFGSLIAKVFRMPDILEGLRDILVTLHDLRIVLNYYFYHKI